MSYYIGIDLGASAVKLLLADAQAKYTPNILGACKSAPKFKTRMSGCALLVARF